MMLTIITILIVIACIGIIGIVLIQNPKGGGISSSFGALNQIGGVKQTTEGVEKVTWVLAIALVVLCLAATPWMRGGGQVKVKGDSPESTIPMMTTVDDGVTAMPTEQAPAKK